jgi:hypothetical protein
VLNVSQFDPERTYRRRRTGALSRARLSCERMPNQSAKDERYPDGQRQQPVRKVGKVFPNGQLLSVVHVKGD